MDMITDMKNNSNSKADKYNGKATHMPEAFSDKATHAMEDFRTKSVEAYDSSVAAVRRSPATWLGAAVGVGVIAGLLFSRRSSK